MTAKTGALPQNGEGAEKPQKYHPTLRDFKVFLSIDGTWDIFAGLSHHNVSFEVLIERIRFSLESDKFRDVIPGKTSIGNAKLTFIVTDLFKENHTFDFEANTTIRIGIMDLDGKFNFAMVEGSKAFIVKLVVHRGRNNERDHQTAHRPRVPRHGTPGHSELGESQASLGLGVTRGSIPSGTGGEVSPSKRLP